MIQLYHRTVGGVFSIAIDLPAFAGLGYHLLFCEKKRLCVKMQRLEQTFVLLPSIHGQMCRVISAAQKRFLVRVSNKLSKLRHCIRW